MQRFINLSVKTVADNVAEIPKKLFGFENKKTNTILKSANYGGFVNEDWKKIGNDMKRGLIAFGRSK